MHPILFQIGPISIYSYGAAIVVAFLVAIYLSRRAAKEVNISQDIIVDSALIMLFSGILGARLLYVIINLKDYMENPIEILMLQHGGLAFYGGAITAFLAEVIYIKVKRLSIYKIGDILIPYIALGQAIGRIGCFLNGCCFGKPTDSMFGVVFPDIYYAVHPTQIYSSLGLLVLYGFLRFLQKTKVKDGMVLISYGLLYSTGRFLIEFIRGDNIVEIFGLTFSQFVSAVIFIVCAILFIIRLKKGYGKTKN